MGRIVIGKICRLLGLKISLTTESVDAATAEDTLDLLYVLQWAKHDEHLQRSLPVSASVKRIQGA